MSSTGFSFLKKKEVPKVGACKKCGFSGHLTYQCRNLIKLGAEKKLEVQEKIVESNSEDEDEGDLNYLTPLQELRKQEIEEEEQKAKEQLKKSKKQRKEKKSKHKKRKHSSSSSGDSDSDSDSDDDHRRRSHKKKKKKHKR